MELTSTDLDDLARFFGRRIDIRLTPVPPPRSRAEDHQRAMAWVLALEEAQDAGRLSALVHRIARLYPNDPTIQQACRLLTDPVRSADQALGLVLVAGASAFVSASLVVLVGVGFFMARSMTAAPAVMGPPPAPEPFGEWAVEGEMLEPTRVVTAPVVGRCGREDGGLVGYWYGGETAPGSVGSEVAMSRMINVRRSHPDGKTPFDPNTPIACTILPGDTVAITAEPIEVKTGVFWVPLHSGDLTAPSVD